MAYTVSSTVSVFGDQRVAMMKIQADAATANIVTPLSVITAHSLAPLSLTSGAIKIYINSGAGGTAIAGVLGISGCTSGDQFVVICYGR